MTHPTITRLQQGFITPSAAICAAPFLTWPPKSLAQWQGTIAATMQRQAQEEGHRKGLPVTAPIGVAQPSHRRAETDNAILDALAVEPLSTAGIAMRTNLPDGTVAYALARLRKAGRVTLTGSGFYSKWHVSMSPSAARIIALLKDNPRSPVKAIAETLLLSGEHVRGLLVSLCQSGVIVVEKENLKKGWRNVYSAK